jgi:class 3 adenylate cyclase
VDVPATQYARSGDVSIAYQVFGNGPFDLVYIPPFVTHLELAWEVPMLAAYFRRLGSFSRLILFDKRGTGMSDRVSGVTDLETRMDDVRTVMDAAGSERAAILGLSEGGPMAIVFAATYPDRLWALVLTNTFPRRLWAPDYPWGLRESEFDQEVAEADRRWGTPEYALAIAESSAPSASTDDQHALARMLRLGGSPGAVVALRKMNREIDVRHVLPSIRVPTLVLNRTGESPFIVQSSRSMARQIPGARHVEVPGVDHAPFSGDVEPAVEALEAFVEEAWAARQWEEDEADRVLATVLFTDIVGSTEKAVELGDRAWREVLEQHHAAIRRELVRFRGREIDTAGDGFFASFDGPARAIRCAQAITASVRQLGLDLRAGLHTGECEVVNDKVGGIAVHIGARVAGAARPGEVLVSQTVKDLVAGSNIAFADRGTAALKGIPGEWRLYAVVSA